jgi:acyl carrier protein
VLRFALMLIRCGDRLNQPDRSTTEFFDGYNMNSVATNADLIDKIKGSLVERFSIDTATVDENSRLRDLGVDSLHLLEIMLDMESELGIKLEDLSVPPNPSLGEVAAAIKRNLEANG